MRDILARKETHDWVIDFFSKEKKGVLLDIPAGTGALAGLLTDMGFSVSCCDIDPSIFFPVQGVEFKKGNLNKSLPYPSESFDFVTCIEGIEHLENPFNAIREFNRILKPGGKLILSLPNYLNIERRLRFLITGLFSKVPSPKKFGKDQFDNLWMLHLTPLTFPILKLALNHYGFKVLSIAKDKEKKGMKFFLPIVWGIKLYCFFWTREAREEFHLNDTLSPVLIMGGNTLILTAEKKETQRNRF